MKRITYISTFSRPLDAAELEEISAVSVRNNAAAGLTGALFTFQSVFYQILEGEEVEVDRCYARIALDDRHRDVFVLRLESMVTERAYPQWSMRTVDLAQTSDPVMGAVRSLLASFTSTHRVLARYTSNFVRDSVQRGIDPTTIVSTKAESVVLFSDIVGSTVLSDLLEPDQMVRLLNRYYDVSGSVLEKAGGEILKLTGDGLMARFAPHQTDEALSACVAILGELGRIRAGARRHDPAQFLAAGFGLSVGPVVVGNVGAGNRLDYTLLGDTVNLAARLEGITRKTGHGVVFGRPFFDRLKNQSAALELGRYRPKGKAEAFAIYGSVSPDARLTLTGAAIRVGLSQGLNRRSADRE